MSIKPDYVEAWNGKGNTLLQKYNEVIVCYDKALEIDSNHSYALNNKRKAIDILKELKWKNKGQTK